jgi:NADH:ubiquinone oxidoreductase subunit 6 (subunit J)
MIFFLFLTFLIFCSFGFISSRNPIHSILFLVCVFMLSSILLLCLGIEFSFILIYVGAFAILFLFVMMMLGLKINDKLFNILQHSEILGQIHFWIFFAGVNVTFFLMHFTVHIYPLFSVCFFLYLVFLTFVYGEVVKKNIWA